MSLPAWAEDRLARARKAQVKKAKAKAKAARIRSRKARSPEALAKKLDALVGQMVRARGRCESGRANHKGNLQWCHGFSRRYHAVRWEPLNGFCLCAGCHLYFTHRPLEWDEWMMDQMGLNYDWLRAKALEGKKPDKAALLADLSRDPSDLDSKQS